MQLIESICPNCGMKHLAERQVDFFGCCMSNVVINSDQYKKTVRIDAKPKPQKPPSLDRPGDAVYILIKRHFGVDPPKGCGCRRVQSNMNAKGWQECLASIDSLANELKANAKQFSWGVTMWAALQATMSGALRWLNPLDPWRSIIREACRLTKEACDEQAKEQQGNGG
jgi:hypothetical protein